jgi:hypothetical protein
MLMLVAALLLPMGISAALAGVARLAGGAERGPRMAGAAVPVAFLVGWGLAAMSGWTAQTDIDRVGHLVLGATIIGVMLDLFADRRAWIIAATIVFSVVYAWSSLTGFEPVSFTGELAIGAAVVTAVAALLLLRLRLMSVRPANTLVLLAMATVGIAAMAATAGLPKITASSLALAGAVMGYLVLVWMAGAAVTEAVIFGAGAALLGNAWAFAAAVERPVGLAILALILFAEGTAGKVPLPKAGVRALLHPLILAGVAALPVILAVVITLAAGR